MRSAWAPTPKGRGLRDVGGFLKIMQHHSGGKARSHSGYRSYILRELFRFASSRVRPRSATLSVEEGSYQVVFELFFACRHPPTLLGTVIRILEREIFRVLCHILLQGCGFRASRHGHIFQGSPCGLAKARRAARRSAAASPAAVLCSGWS